MNTKSYPANDQYFEKAERKITAEKLLNLVKVRAGKVVTIPLSGKTALELPANLSAEEKALRIDRYIRRFKNKI